MAIEDICTILKSVKTQGVFSLTLRILLKARKRLLESGTRVKKGTDYYRVDGLAQLKCVQMLS